VIECAKRWACNARNAGLEHVDTEWTMFFDSDDQMKPGHCMRAMQYAEGADVVGWNMMMYHQDGSPYRSMPFVNHDLLYNNIMLSSFSTQRYMARTELFRHAGGWLPDAQVYDDVELGVRLLKLNPRIAKAAGKATVDVYITEGSIYTDTTDKLSRITVALDAIEAELPANQRHWVDLQRLLKASTWGKDDPAAPALARDVLARQPWMRRMLWRLFYRYSLRGGRGVARLYRPLTYLGF
jgi:glycosyltransferase involved in cell wall biosynthesis